MKSLPVYCVVWMVMLSVTACASIPVEESASLQEEAARVGAPSTVENQEIVLPEIHEGATLKDYLMYAALNNAGLEAAFYNWKAALERIPQVSSLPDPRFTYGYFFQSVETRVGPQEHRFGLSQSFPWIGKLEVQGTAAAEAARAARARYEAAMLNLFYQVKDAFYEYYYLEHAIAMTRENLELVKYLESVTRSLYAGGIADFSDVVRTQVRLGELENQVQTLATLLDPVAARLNAVLNRPPNAPLYIPPELHEEIVDISEEQIMSWLDEHNPELQAMQFAAQRARWNIALAKKNFYPDITLGIETIDTAEAISPGTPDSGKNPVIGSISLNIPVWWNKYRAAVREAEAAYKASVEDVVERKNGLIADTQLVLYRYRDAERRVDLYEDALVPKAKQSVDVSLESYRTGAGTFLEVIDAVRTLLDFQLAYERAFADRAQRLAELEMLTGIDFPKSVKQVSGKGSQEDKRARGKRSD